MNNEKEINNRDSFSNVLNYDVRRFCHSNNNNNVEKVDNSNQRTDSRVERGWKVTSRLSGVKELVEDAERETVNVRPDWSIARVKVRFYEVKDGDINYKTPIGHHIKVFSKEALAIYMRQVSKLRLSRVYHYATLGEFMHSLNKEQVLVDAIVRVQGQIFALHRHVLSCHSKVFARLFINSHVPAYAVTEVTCDDISVEAFAQFVHFIHIGEVHLSPYNVSAMLELSVKLQSESLRAKILFYMSKREQLTLSEAVDILAGRESSDDKPEALATVIKDFQELLQKPTCLTDIAFEDFKEILSSEYLSINIELDVFWAALYWMACNPIARQEHFLELLSLVRFGTMSTLELMDCARATGLVGASEKCKELLVKANWISYIREKGIKDPLGIPTQLPRVVLRDAPRYEVTVFEFDMRYMVYKKLAIDKDDPVEKTLNGVISEEGKSAKRVRFSPTVQLFPSDGDLDEADEGESEDKSETQEKATKQGKEYSEKMKDHSDPSFTSHSAEDDVDFNIFEETQPQGGGSAEAKPDPKPDPKAKEGGKSTPDRYWITKALADAFSPLINYQTKSPVNGRVKKDKPTTDTPEHPTDDKDKKDVGRDKKDDGRDKKDDTLGSKLKVDVGHDKKDDTLGSKLKDDVGHDKKDDTLGSKLKDDVGSDKKDDTLGSKLKDDVGHDKKDDTLGSKLKDELNGNTEANIPATPTDIGQKENEENDAIGQSIPEESQDGESKQANEENEHTPSNRKKKSDSNKLKNIAGQLTKQEKTDHKDANKGHGRLKGEKKKEKKIPKQPTVKENESEEDSLDDSLDDENENAKRNHIYDLSSSHSDAFGRVAASSSRSKSSFSKLHSSVYNDIKTKIYKMAFKRRNQTRGETASPSGMYFKSDTSLTDTVTSSDGARFRDGQSKSKNSNTAFPETSSHIDRSRFGQYQHGNHSNHSNHNNHSSGGSSKPSSRVALKPNVQRNAASLGVDELSSSQSGSAWSLLDRREVEMGLIGTPLLRPEATPLSARKGTFLSR